MFKQYFKFIVRKLSRNRVYTVINIVGLSIAFSAAWLIYSHTSNEWNMDGYLKNSDNIYRVITRYGDEDFWNCRTNTPFGPAAKRTFPEIVQVARYFQKDYRIKIKDDQDFTIEPKLAFVDPPFFDLFEIPVIQGKIDTTVFSWIVFTETSAKRYFNKENPIGKTVTIKDGINNRKKDIKCQVVAVIKDFPANSTIQANIIVDCRQGIPYFDEHRGNYSLYTYFHILPTADLRAIEKKLPTIASNMPDDVNHYSHRLQPLKDIYFHSDHLREDELLRGSQSLTYLLWSITILILLLAAGNFLLIRIAQQDRDSSRFAIHKCYGASNKHLFYQLLGEIGLQTGVILLLSCILTYGLHPYFIQILSPEHIYPFELFNLSNFVFVGFICLIMGIICSILYFHFKHHVSREGVRGMLQPKPQQINLSKILTILQIGIFTSLLFYCTIIISQINFILNSATLL